MNIFFLLRLTKRSALNFSFEILKWIKKEQNRDLVPKYIIPPPYMLIQLEETIKILEESQHNYNQFSK